MASLNTLINNLTTSTQANDRFTLGPRFHTGEIPTQDDFFGLIYSPLSRVDDGIFKTLDNPLCIQSVGTGDKDVIHLYDDNTSEPLWKITLENDDLNVNSETSELFTFGSGGNLTVRQGSVNVLTGGMTLGNLLRLNSSDLMFAAGGQDRWRLQGTSSNLMLRNVRNSSGTLINEARMEFRDTGDVFFRNSEVRIVGGDLHVDIIDGNRVELGAAASTSHVVLDYASGIYVEGGELELQGADLVLREASTDRWRLQTDSNRLRFRSVNNGISRTNNTDLLILGGDGSLTVKEGTIVNDWVHGSGNDSMHITNLASAASANNWNGNNGLLSQVSSDGNSQRYGLIGEAFSGTAYGGANYGIYGKAEGNGFITVPPFNFNSYTNNYGVYGNADGNATSVGVYGVASGTRAKYGVQGRASGSGSNYGVYGYATGGTNDYAGYFVGDRVYVNGQLGVGYSDPGTNRLAVNGRAYATSGWASTFADYGELFEASGKTAIPLGTAVVFSRYGKIRPAKEGETPFGIVTRDSAVVGNSYIEWPGKYELDEWGNKIMEEVEEEIEIPDPENYDPKELNPENPNMLKTGKKVFQPKLSKNYDPKKEYTRREDRPEWCMVGLLGQLRLRKGQPVADSWVRIKKISDEIELWLVK